MFFLVWSCESLFAEFASVFAADNNKSAHDNDDAMNTRFLFFIVITFFLIFNIVDRYRHVNNITKTKNIYLTIY